MYEMDINNGILNFDMEEFFAPRTTEDSNGAILLITSSQIVLALNSNNGEGSHARAFAEAISEIYGIPIENGTLLEISRLSSIADSKINARLINEREAGTYFAFLLSEVQSITENEYKTFERFYYKYNDIIKNISKSYGFPIVHCIVPNYDENIKSKFGNKAKSITIESDDLTPVLEAARKLVDKEKKDDEEKNIIELSRGKSL